MAYIECVCVTLKGIQVDKELKREKHMCHESTMHNRMNMTDLNLMTTSVLSVPPPRPHRLLHHHSLTPEVRQSNKVVWLSEFDLWLNLNSDPDAWSGPKDTYAQSKQTHTTDKSGPYGAYFDPFVTGLRQTTQLTTAAETFPPHTIDL